MKIIRLVLSIFIMSSLCFGQVAQITIPEGTMIRVRLEQDLSSATAQEGQSVQLSVMDAVRIGETEAILQGANVTGRVILAQEKRRMGRTGKLDFSIDRVMAVDKTNIPLRYTSNKKEGGSTAVSTGIITAGVAALFFPVAPLVLLRKGKNATIPRGMTFEVYTDQLHVLSTSSVTRNAVVKTTIVSIESVPPGADVEIDGLFVGNTPLSLDVPIGECSVVVKKKGFITWSRILKATSGNVNINAELEIDTELEIDSVIEVQQNRLERPEADDTTEEKVFRTYIRARLGNLEIIDDDEVISAAKGKFKLDKEQALRVFDQEIERLHQEVVRYENIKKYQEDFEIFVMDGVIDKDERGVLNAIAESLSLTAEDIKTVESNYVFKDENAPPAAKKSTSSR